MDKKPKLPDNPHVAGANYYKRVGAFLLDLVLVTLFALMAFFTGEAIHKTLHSYKSNAKALYTTEKASGLFIYSDVNEVTYTYEEKITAPRMETLYLGALEHFYLHALNPADGKQLFVYEASTYYTHNTSFNYYTMVLGEGRTDTAFLFSDVDGEVTYTFKSELTDREKNDVWQRLYNEALTNLNRVPYYSELRQYLLNFLNINLLLSVLLGSVLPLLGAPLFFGHGRTLGKFVLRLAVVNTDGYAINKMQVVIRFLTTSLVELASNFMLFFVPLLLTSALATITKKNRAIHDLISKTYVIDLRTSKIYNSAQSAQADGPYFSEQIKN